MKTKKVIKTCKHHYIEFDLGQYGSIHKSGSVVGMRKRYGLYMYPVQVGEHIYDVPEAVYSAIESFNTHE